MLPNIQILKNTLFIAKFSHSSPVISESREESGWNNEGRWNGIEKSHYVSWLLRAWTRFRLLFPAVCPKIFKKKSIMCLCARRVSGVKGKPDSLPAIYATYHDHNHIHNWNQCLSIYRMVGGFCVLFHSYFLKVWNRPYLYPILWMRKQRLVEGNSSRIWRIVSRMENSNLSQSDLRACSLNSFVILP